MPEIRRDDRREIINDFKNEIVIGASQEDPEQKYKIDFRDDIPRNIQRTVWLIPLQLLRYRKDNSRINSNILEYEHLHEPLDERNVDHQQIIAQMLEDSDIDKMEALLNDMALAGQRRPAIATCDGFLINGNRRKRALELLSREQTSRRINKLVESISASPHMDFTRMRVVILPSDDAEDGYGDGGRPTEIEIQRIEYAYQNQDDGRSEYSGINKALQYKKNEELGWTLEDQLNRDPQTANLQGAARTRAITKIRNTFTEPLARVDEYLDFFGRPKMYQTVSKSSEDSRGRWYSFKDMNGRIHQQLHDDRKRAQLGVNEDEIGKITSVAFKVIRQGDLKGTSRLNDMMRLVPKILQNPEAKKELYKIDAVPHDLEDEEKVDAEGQPRSLKDVDNLWSGKHGETIINHVKKAKRIVDFEGIQEKPIELLIDALSKLNHRDMNTTQINISDIGQCMELCETIVERTDELNTEFDRHRMKLQKLQKKH
tara:strand:- start:2359 stop:3813 length:1455 start_codon:yes stop_codon:yes gene_type:complete